MHVPMVAVRRVRMAMPERRVDVRMAMRLARVDGAVMCMVVMVIVGVAVFVGKFEMLVDVLVAFAEMQPHPESHQGAGQEKLDGDGLAEQGNRHHGADEGRDRKIGAGPGRSEVAQREHEQQGPEVDRAAADCPTELRRSMFGRDGCHRLFSRTHHSNLV